VYVCGFTREDHGFRVARVKINHVAFVLSGPRLIWPKDVMCCSDSPASSRSLALSLSLLFLSLPPVSLSLSLRLSHSFLSLLSCLLPSLASPHFSPGHTYSQDRQQQQQQEPSVLFSGMHLRPRGQRNGRSLSDPISLELSFLHPSISPL
jgi:hypothetical protein